MAPHFSTVPLLVLIFLNSLLSASANLHRFKPNSLTISTTTQSDTVFFEVTKPISVPNTKPCVHHLLTHDFGYTLNKPPVVTNYTPPSHCPSSFSKIVLEWNATCKGRQFDRIFGIWLGGVELLRSCTAEPTRTGIFWSVRKDITKYSSLLLGNRTQDLSIFLGNIVDGTYTGIYHVNVSMYFYPSASEVEHKFQKKKTNNYAPADLVLPISRNNVQSLNDGLWFEIENSTQFVSKELVGNIPPNVYRAVLEVYVSPHGDDEFWYTNYPNDYIISNNITGSPGNGPFREVVVSLDGNTVIGAIWPFTVIYTGGIINLFWRPISGIGSFDLPSYNIEVTPFLGTLLDDSKKHSFGFRVTNALDVWFVDANLHLWLDSESEKTEAKLVKHDSDLRLDVHSNFEGLDGEFTTQASRSVYSQGWVKSSHGNITTRFEQRLRYNNSMELRKDGHVQIVNQTISTNDVASFKPKSLLLKSKKKFSIKLYTDTEEKENNTVSYATDLTLGFGSREYGGGRRNGINRSAVENVQKAKGEIVVKGNLVTSGVAATKQRYRYRGGDGLCYFRDVKSNNYTILADKQGTNCNHS